MDIKLKFNKNNLMNQILIYPGEDGFWVAECSGLPGCITQGTTKEAAKTNIREAIELYIEVLENDDAASFREE